MTKRMLIDAAHPEETRVVIVDSNRVEELDFESRNKRQLRGNVYLARVTRVEPSLQAAFIEYGGNRHGFLAFSEIHPDYYRIPEADKLALKEQEEEDQRIAEEEEEKRKAAVSRRKIRSKSDDTSEEDGDEDEVDSDDSLEGEEEDERDENLDPDDDDATDESDAEVADEQVNVAVKRRKRISRRRYKIQEVIKRGQILLVQAVKEERGNKGAAMTTYLSLAGRYCVLMPNTPRGGGISRKIANGSDRKRLKSVMNGLDVPKGMGVIVRTAGAKRTKAEIERDYEYLSRLWSEIRETTMESSAPSLIHEEGNLVKRSIRDLYNKDIEEVLVQGDEAYETANTFINMLMPSHAENVKHYTDEIPLFLRYGAEKQIENSLDATVQLKSGGYLVIHPTEALVSVDVNSGRSTKERNIERTALRTNLEAAEELARQMRLRDLAGLIVVDFIDMDENKNNRAVERKMKEMLAQDRARIQTSRISQFGLMEISRQRRRRSLLEGSTTSCPHCSGVGRKRTVESSALAAIRAVEEFAVRGKAKRIRLKTSQDVALYLLNEKRDLLTQVDQVADVFTEVVGDDAYIRPHYELEVIEKREDKRADPLIKIERDFKKEREEEKRKPKKSKSEKQDNESESDADENTSSDEDGDDENRKSGRRRSRRGRRGGRGRGRREDKPKSEESGEAPSETVEIEEAEGDSKPKRGRRRRSGGGKSDAPTTDAKTDETSTDDEATKRGRRRRAPSKNKDVVVETAVEETPATEEKPKRRSTTRRKAPTRNKSENVEAAEATEKPKRTRRAPAKKKAEAGEAEAEKPARKRRAPAKKTADAGSAEAKPSRTRRAPAKKVQAANVDESEATKPARKRKAPAKAKAEANVTPDAEAKPKRTRKAPVKKAAAEAETPKPTRTRKAPVKKAPVKKATAKSVDADTEAEAPKRTRKAPAKTAAKPAAAKKAPAKKALATKPAAKKAAAKKAPAKKAAPKAKATDADSKPARTRKAPAKAAPEAETKAAPTRTRKAPVKAASAAKVETPAAKPEPAKPAPIAAKPAPEKPAAPAKKSRLGWWKRGKKD